MTRIRTSGTLSGQAATHSVGATSVSPAYGHRRFAPAEPPGFTAQTGAAGEITVTVTAIPAAAPAVTAVQYSTDGGDTWADLPSMTLGAAQAIAAQSNGAPFGQGAAIPLRMRATNSLVPGTGPVSDVRLILTGTGAPAGDTSVNISIRRGTDRVAPEGIVFMADGHAGFDLPPQTALAVWKPAWHRLLHVWDFGPAYDEDFDTLDALPAEWRSKRYAYGPQVMHFFPSSGSPTATLRLYDMTGQLVHEEVVTFDGAGGSDFEPIGDAAAKFAGSRTIFVDPAGDFATVPVPGCQTFTSFDAALAAYQALGETGQLLLRDGADVRGFTSPETIGAEYRNFRLGAWPGTGARPELGGGFKAAADMPSGADFVAWGLSCVASFDGTDYTGTAGSAWSANNDGICVLADTYLKGLKGYMQGSTLQHAVTALWWGVACDGYTGSGGNLTDEHPGHRFLQRGCRCALPNDILMKGEQSWHPDVAERWIFRLEGYGAFCIDQCDYFNHVGNGSATTNVTAGDRPYGHSFIRMNHHDPAGGYFMSIQRAAIEGSLDSSAKDGDSRAGNLLWDKILFKGNCQRDTLAKLYISGSTVRNIVFARDNSGPIQSTGFGSFLNIKNDADTTNKEPVEVYGVTYTTSLTADHQVKTNGAYKRPAALWSADPVDPLPVAHSNAVVWAPLAPQITGLSTADLVADGPFADLTPVQNRLRRLHWNSSPGAPVRDLIEHHVWDDVNQVEVPTGDGQIPLGTDSAH